MVSLTTVYVVSIILASITGMGSAFVGNKFYPIQGGAVIPPPTLEEVTEDAEKVAKNARKLVNATDEAKKISKEKSETEPNIFASEEKEPEPTPASEPEPTRAPEPPPVAEPVAEPTPAPEPVAQPVEEELDDESPLELKYKLVNGLIKKIGGNEEIAQNITEFIETPVKDWKKIAKSEQELTEKFNKTIEVTGDDKCPPELIDICKIVYLKHLNMLKFIDDKEYVNYDDQTSAAISVLENSQ
jgi:hypothetical protein